MNSFGRTPGPHIIKCGDATTYSATDRNVLAQYARHLEHWTSPEHMRSIRSWHARFVEVMTMFHSAGAHHQHANKESTFMPTRIPLQVVRRGIVMDQAQTLPPHGGSRRSGHLSFLKQTTA